jgi:uncharacterized protein
MQRREGRRNSVALELTKIKSEDVPGFEDIAIVDCDVHNEVGAEMLPLLPKQWQRYLSEVGLRTFPTEAVLRLPQRPRASRRDASPPSGGLAGSDPEFARDQLLNEYGISAAVISNIALGAGNAPLELERAMVRATNELNESWHQSDPRWLLSISSAITDPAWSAEEIRLCSGRGDHYVQVLLDTHGERPAGNPMYWPIFDAAVECGLPVAFHITAMGKLRLSTGVGASTYYAETKTSADVLAQPLVCSLIFEGVFDRWPTLKIALIELDWSWVVPLAWRLDATWRVLRDEVPTLQRRPSEYLRDHFWFSTQPGLEAESRQQTVEAYEQLEHAGFGDRLMFASDYPHWDMDSPFEGIPRRLSRSFKQRILGGNAADLYQLNLDRAE